MKISYTVELRNDGTYIVTEDGGQSIPVHPAGWQRTDVDDGKGNYDDDYCLSPGQTIEEWLDENGYNDEY